MIHTLKGKLADRNDSSLVVEVGGVGFQVFTNERTAAEAAVGLAIVIMMMRNRQSLNIERINLLKF